MGNKLLTIRNVALRSQFFKQAQPRYQQAIPCLQINRTPLYHSFYSSLIMVFISLRAKGRPTSPAAKRAMDIGSGATDLPSMPCRLTLERAGKASLVVREILRSAGLFLR